MSLQTQRTNNKYEEHNVMVNAVQEPITQEERRRRALERVLEALKKEKGVLAVLLFGSLSEGVVWEKSDLNLVVIVRDDQLPDFVWYHIDEDDIVVDVKIHERSLFTRAIKLMNTPQIGTCGDALPLPPDGRMLYCTDDSIKDIFEDIMNIGKADMERALLPRACSMLYYLKKAEKSVRAYGDPNYARVCMLEFAKYLAETELCLNYKAPTKEPLLQASVVNPALMRRFYEYPLNNALDSDAVLALIKEGYEYVDSHIDLICRQLLRFLASDGDPKRVSVLIDQFRARVIHITEYLYEKGVIDKVSVPIRVTLGGRPVVEEIAYIYEK
jgi:predicted nucleotidyltransferase